MGLGLKQTEESVATARVVVIEGRFGFVVGERKEPKPKPKPKPRRALRGAIEDVESVVATAKVAIPSEEGQTRR